MKINCTRRARSIDACEYQIQRNAYQSTRRRRLSTGKERYGTENASVYEGLMDLVFGMKMKSSSVLDAFLSIDAYKGRTRVEKENNQSILHSFVIDVVVSVVVREERETNSFIHSCKSGRKRRATHRRARDAASSTSPSTKELAPHARERRARSYRRVEGNTRR
jgi:hypothetical protein